MGRLKIVAKKSGDTNLCVITNDAREYAKLTYEQEEKRENSLISQATQMTTYFSFVSVVVLMIIPLLVFEGSVVPSKYVAFVSVVTLFLLFLSMILAVLVQWRFPYEALPSPEFIFDYICQNKEFYQTVEQRNKSYIQTIEKTWSSKRKVNDLRVDFLRASMIFFGLAIAFYMVSTIYAIIIYVYI